MSPMYAEFSPFGGVLQYFKYSKYTGGGGVVGRSMRIAVCEMFGCILRVGKIGQPNSGSSKGMKQILCIPYGSYIP